MVDLDDSMTLAQAASSHTRQGGARRTLTNPPRPSRQTHTERSRRCRGTDTEAASSHTVREGRAPGTQSQEAQGRAGGCAETEQQQRHGEHRTRETVAQARESAAASRLSGGRIKVAEAISSSARSTASAPKLPDPLLAAGVGSAPDAPPPRAYAERAPAHPPWRWRLISRGTPRR